MNLGHGYLQVGAYVLAESAFRSVLEFAEREGITYVAAGAKNNLGLLYAIQGKLEEARALELEAIAAFTVRDRRYEGGSRVRLAIIHLLSGDFAAAEEEASKANDLFSPGSSLHVHALAVRARARLLAAAPTPWRRRRRRWISTSRSGSGPRRATPWSG
jgi:tetratricopeptide (TPR) repeat protein